MASQTVGGAARLAGAGAISAPKRDYNAAYEGAYNSRVAFPLGGMGGGMICLEGMGALSHFSLHNTPNMFNDPCAFSALCVKGEPNVARVLEGQIQDWKIFGLPGSGNGLGDRDYGLPRFTDSRFQARFPFGEVDLSDSDMPVDVKITGWSPFSPNDVDNASLPVAGVEYTFRNTSDRTIEAVYSFNAKNFMQAGTGKHGITPAPRGFRMFQEGTEDEPWHEGAFVASVADPEAKVNLAWFRGGWFDSLTMAWKDIEEGKCFDRPAVDSEHPAPGATIFVPFTLEPGKEKTVVLQLAWYAGHSNIRRGRDPEKPTDEELKTLEKYQPWYSTRFEDSLDVASYWWNNYNQLREDSQRFSECFYDTTLPAEVVEAVAANLTILKSPTVLREENGRLWCWEGCHDLGGCCHGTCTHVWNYAQALPHLFPQLERGLRDTEYFNSQNEEGHQSFRTPLPIRPAIHHFHAASDGQLGGVMKVYRDWRISGDTGWLREIWPKVKQSLSFCIEAWDPRHKGVLEEPHHNTYDIEFWGPNGMCSSFYLGALAAAVKMGEAIGDDVPLYKELLEKGCKFVETELWDGEYFFQKVQWTGLNADDPTKVESMVGHYSPEAAELLQKEGPKYQYGKGCISDGVLGCWIGLVCGVGEFLDHEKVASHVKAVHKYNLKRDLREHPNPQRPSFAVGNEGGLLLCTWPKGGALSLPFVYSNEVWTGIEYQVASHLMFMGYVEEGLEIVRVCRDRYDGRIRNPFNEYECGHWYARAMASYGLLQGMTGVRYDAVDKTLYIEPRIRGDFRTFLSTATGYGTVGVKDGKPFIEVKHGTIDVKETRFVPTPLA